MANILRVLSLLKKKVQIIHVFNSLFLLFNEIPKNTKDTKRLCFVVKRVDGGLLSILSSVSYIVDVKGNGGISSTLPLCSSEWHVNRNEFI